MQEFLMEVLRATEESDGHSEVIYPLLQANLDKLDDNFACILQTWVNAELLEIESDAAEGIANAIWDFSAIIQQFPLGNKANNMEIAIAGYKQILKVFTRNSNPKNWADIQNNLGVAYSERIQGDTAENLEKAIAAYQTSIIDLYKRRISHRLGRDSE